MFLVKKKDFVRYLARQSIIVLFGDISVLLNHLNSVTEN